MSREQFHLDRMARLVYRSGCRCKTNEIMTGFHISVRPVVRPSHWVTYFGSAIPLGNRGRGDRRRLPRRVNMHNYDSLIQPQLPSKASKRLTGSLWPDLVSSRTIPKCHSRR